MISIEWIYVPSPEVCLKDMREVADEKSPGAFDKYLSLIRNPCEGTVCPLHCVVYTRPKMCLFLSILEFRELLLFFFTL